MIRRAHFILRQLTVQFLFVSFRRAYKKSTVPVMTTASKNAVANTITPWYFSS